MRKWMVLLIYIAGLVSFSSACGEPDDVGGEAPVEDVEEEPVEDVEEEPVEDEDLSVESFPRAYARMMCERVFSCCSEEELARMDRGRGFEGDEDCHAFYIAEMEDELEENAEARAAGRVGFNAESAAECLAEMRAAACAEGLSRERVKLDVCAGIYEGLVEAGGECAGREECKSNRCPHIELGSHGEVNTIRVCDPVVGAGEACQWDLECRDGLICDAKLDLVTGVRSGVCREPNGANEPCNSMRECNADTYCDVYETSGPASSEGVCVKIKSPGDSCTIAYQCKGLNCRSDFDDMGGPKTCHVEKSICSGG